LTEPLGVLDLLALRGFLLRRLIDKNRAYPAAFSYSVLQTLPRTFARAEVLKAEQHYKTKLGSRAIGLNAN
jgi:hypothetical protein